MPSLPYVPVADVVENRHVKSTEAHDKRHRGRTPPGGWRRGPAQNTPRPDNVVDSRYWAEKGKDLPL